MSNKNKYYPNYHPKYLVDVKLINKNLVDIYRETSKIKKYGRSNYLLLEALNKLNKHDIHNLSKFDKELDKLENEFNTSDNFNDLGQLILLANNLNNFVFDKYVGILDKLKGGVDNEIH